MNLSTTGNAYYSGYTLAISVAEDIVTLESDDAKDFYKILFMESGILIFLSFRISCLLQSIRICFIYRNSGMTHVWPLSLSRFRRWNHPSLSTSFSCSGTSFPCRRTATGPAAAVRICLKYYFFWQGRMKSRNPFCRRR